MQRYILIEFVEEGNAFTNQDRQNGIANLISETEPEALARYRAATNKPDGQEPGFQVLIDKLGKLA